MSAKAQNLAEVSDADIAELSRQIDEAAEKGDVAEIERLSELLWRIRRARDSEGGAA